MRFILRLSLIHLRRAPLRSALSALAVSFGVAALVAADLISRAVTHEIARTAEAQAITGFMSEQLDTGLTTIGLVVACGAGFLTFNALAMAVAQRRQDLGRLRAAGMTRRQVLAMVLAEAGWIGLAGAALGAAGGVGLSRALISLVAATSGMFNRFGTPEVSPTRLLVSAGLGIVVALLAAVAPAGQALRVPPLAALRPPQPGGLTAAPRRLALACAAIAAGLWAYLALAPPGAWMQPPWANRLSVLLGVVWLGCVALSAPGLIDAAGRLLRRPLGGGLGVAGRLASDNLRRARPRLVYTVLTLAVAVAMIVGVTGYLTYWFDELFFRTADSALRDNPGLGFFPIDVEAGLQAYSGVSSFTMPEGLPGEVEAIAGSRATVLEAYFVLAPELSFLGERYFSYVLDPAAVRRAGPLFFSFSAGDWDQALAIAAQGCALFLTPTVAARNQVGLGEPLTIQTPAGPLDCTVAGVGPTFVGASIISDAALGSFGLAAPLSLTVFPHTPADRAALQPQLQALAEAHPGVWLIDLAHLTRLQREGMKSVRVVMDAMLLLAVISAALGVVNTAAIGLAERRREFGLLRAAGASRAQVRTVLLAEGLLLGGLGASLGVAAGVGLVLIYIVVSAGSPLGFPDFPIWPAALASARPALGRGLLAAAATPALAALAAWLPARRMLRGSVAETLASRANIW